MTLLLRRANDSLPKGAVVLPRTSVTGHENIDGVDAPDNIAVGGINDTGIQPVFQCQREESRIKQATCRHAIRYVGDGGRHMIEDETLVAVKTQGPYLEYWQTVEDIIGKLGITFKEIKYTANANSIAFEMKQNHCVALMDTFFRPFGQDDLRYFELEESDAIYGFLLAYMPQNPNPMIKPFIKEALTVAKSL